MFLFLAVSAISARSCHAWRTAALLASPDAVVFVFGLSVPWETRMFGARRARPGWRVLGLRRPWHAQAWVGSGEFRWAGSGAATRPAQWHTRPCDYNTSGVTSSLGTEIMA